MAKKDQSARTPSSRKATSTPSSRKATRKPTSIDVARAAGVSQSTVSYVLTGKRSISDNTRVRVEKAIADLGFVPNVGARALAGSRSGVIGLVLPLSRGVELGTNMRFVSAIAEAARDFEYDVLLATADEGSRGIARLRDNGLCDGVILMDVEADDVRVTALRELGMPGVVIGVPDNRDAITCIDLDFQGAGRDAIQLLAGRGHRRIGLLSPGEQGHRKSMSFARRFARGCMEASPDDVDIVVREVVSDSMVLESITRELLTGDNPCTALVVHLSSAVEPELTVLRHLGYEVGKDCDVVALCLDDVAEKYSGEVDALLLQPDEVSRRATKALFDQLDGTAIKRPDVPASTAAQVTANASGPSGPVSYASSTSEEGELVLIPSPLIERGKQAVENPATAANPAPEKPAMTRATVPPPSS